MISDVIRLIRNFILVIGPKEAGKTSILKRMVTGSFMDTEPTFGLSEEIVRKIRVIELGGQENYQQYWNLAIKQNPIHIFYVVDITKPQELSDFETFLNQKEFSSLKEIITLCLNKTDLLDTQEPSVNINVPYVTCSAKNGTGILDILELIATFGYQQKIESSKNSNEIEIDAERNDDEKVNKIFSDYEGKL